MGKFISKTTEQYKQELIDKDKKFLCVDKYVGANIKILHKCIECGYEFMATPHVILRSGVCPNCSNEINSTEKYKNRLTKDRPDMEVLEEWKGRNIPILHRHSCGHIYKIDPNHVLEVKGIHGCENCYRRMRIKTNDEFVNQLPKQFSNYRYIGEYVNSKEKIKVICDNGHESYMYPSNLLRGHKCKQCVANEWGKQCRLTNEEFESRIKKEYPNIQLLSNYEKSNTPIKYHCSICGITTIVNNAYSLLAYGCNCNRPNGEQKISQYLSKKNIEFIPQMKFDGLVGESKKLSYDFYVPLFNLLIEYQGEQHERPIEHFGGEEQFIKQQKYDSLKEQYAKENGYNILYIWYYDYDNVENILNTYLNQNP